MADSPEDTTYELLYAPLQEPSEAELLAPPGPIPIDPCMIYRNQASLARTRIDYVRKILQRRSGNNFIQSRKTLADEEMERVLLSFARPWNGLIPIFVPLECRSAYSSWRTRARFAYYLLAFLQREAKTSVYDSRGFFRKRWHRQRRNRMLGLITQQIGS